MNNWFSIYFDPLIGPIVESSKNPIDFDVAIYAFPPKIEYTSCGTISFKIDENYYYGFFDKYTENLDPDERNARMRVFLVSGNDLKELIQYSPSIKKVVSEINKDRKVNEQTLSNFSLQKTIPESLNINILSTDKYLELLYPLWKNLISNQPVLIYHKSSFNQLFNLIYILQYIFSSSKHNIDFLYSVIILNMNDLIAHKTPFIGYTTDYIYVEQKFCTIIDDQSTFKYTSGDYLRNPRAKIMNNCCSTGRIIPYENLIPHYISMTDYFFKMKNRILDNPDIKLFDNSDLNFLKSVCQSDSIKIDNSKIVYN